VYNKLKNQKNQKSELIKMFSKYKQDPEKISISTLKKTNNNGKQSKHPMAIMSTSDYLKSKLVKVVSIFDESVAEEIKGNFDKAEEAFRKAKPDIEEVKYNYSRRRGVKYTQLNSQASARKVDTKQKFCLLYFVYLRSECAFKMKPVIWFIWIF